MAMSVEVDPRANRELKGFPNAAWQRASHGINKLAAGKDVDIKPLKTLGAWELRIRTKEGWFRINLAVIASTVWVLCAYPKKSNRVPKRIMDVTKKRLRELHEQLTLRPAG